MSCTSCPSTLAAQRASRTMTGAGARHTSGLALEASGERAAGHGQETMSASEDTPLESSI